MVSNYSNLKLKAIQQESDAAADAAQAVNSDAPLAETPFDPLKDILEKFRKPSERCNKSHFSFFTETGEQRVLEGVFVSKNRMDKAVSALVMGDAELQKDCMAKLTPHLREVTGYVYGETRGEVSKVASGPLAIV
eukprot:g19913.t1